MRQGVMVWELGFRIDGFGTGYRN